MTDKQQDPWEITLSGEEFERLKQDERFWAVLTLARTVNALRFVQVAGISEEDTPSAQRQRMNSFLFLGAILYEGLQFAGILGKYFRDIPEFKEGFGELFKDRKLRAFIVVPSINSAISSYSTSTGTWQPKPSATTIFQDMHSRSVGVGKPAMRTTGLPTPHRFTICWVRMGKIAKETHELGSKP